MTPLWCAAFCPPGRFAWVNRPRIRLAWPLLVALIGLAAAMRGTTYYHVAYFVAMSYATFFLAYVPKLPRIRHHDISYGLYLYGWPAQQLVLHFVPGSGPLFNTFWATLLAGTLAALSWRFVERPALQWKRRLDRRPPTALPETVPEPPLAAIRDPA